MTVHVSIHILRRSWRGRFTDGEKMRGDKSIELRNRFVNRRYRRRPDTEKYIINKRIKRVIAVFSLL